MIVCQSSMFGVTGLYFVEKYVQAVTITSNHDMEMLCFFPGTTVTSIAN